MDQGAGGGGGGGGSQLGGDGRGGTPSYEVGGGRQRFTVELRPGETTIVSWKKLLKDATAGGTSAGSSAVASKSNGSGPGPDLNVATASTSTQVNNNSGGPSSSQPPPPHPSLDSRLAQVSFWEFFHFCPLRLGYSLFGLVDIFVLGRGKLGKMEGMMGSNPRIG